MGVPEKGCRTTDRAEALHHSEVAFSLQQTTQQAGSTIVLGASLLNSSVFPPTPFLQPFGRHIHLLMDHVLEQLETSGPQADISCGGKYLVILFLHERGTLALEPPNASHS